MQKKKKYYEIKDGGVTLYWDMTANMLVDIDVQPGVKTVNLFVEKTVSNYPYSTCELPTTCSRRSGGFWSRTIFFPANVAQASPGVPPVVGSIYR